MAGISQHHVLVTAEQFNEFWYLHTTRLTRQKIKNGINDPLAWEYVPEGHRAQAWEWFERIGHTSHLRFGVDKDVWQDYTARPEIQARLKGDVPPHVNVTAAQRVAELEAEVAHWKANHADQVRRNRFLLERPDLPVERIPAYHHLALVEELLRQAMKCVEPGHALHATVHKLLGADA